MIRSWIGIVCVLVFVATCVQTSAAQASGSSFNNSLRTCSTETRLRDWIALADQGCAERILSSDAYHNDFRFHAAPLKPLRNWQMPIVDVRPAKMISITPDRKIENESPVPTTDPLTKLSITPVINWVWQSAAAISDRYCELRDQFEQITLAIIPQPIVPQPVKSKPAPSKQTLSTGPVDYWNYYADCDRWNVVFAVPGETQSTRGAQDQKIAAVKVRIRRQTRVNLGLHPIAAQVAERWEEVISVCRSFSQQTQTSQR